MTTRSQAFGFHIVRTIGRKLLCMAVAFTLLRCLLLPPFWTDRRLDLPSVDKCDFTLIRGSFFEQTETTVTDPDAQALFYVLAQQARAGWTVPSYMLMLGGESCSVHIHAGEYIYTLTLSGATGSTSTTVCVSKRTADDRDIIWNFRVYHVPPELLERAIEAFHRLVPDAPEELL